MTIRILVVNDSATARAALRIALSDEKDLTIVGELSSGEKAVEAVGRLVPDVVLMDIVMPHADGYEVTRHILRARRIPILMISASVSAKDVAVALEALRSGAIAVLEAPPPPTDPAYEHRRRAIIHTIRSAAALPRDRSMVTPIPLAEPPALEAPVRSYSIVGIAASLGGPPVVAEILGALPPDHPPIVLVQHIESSFVDGFVMWLGSVVKTKVVVATDGENAERGTVFIAPAEHHIGVSRDGRIALAKTPPIGGFRPSATHMLQSLAKGYGRRALGVVLTGMGRDGADGAAALHDAGGFVIAQDEASCAVAGMPNAARSRNAVDLSLAPAAIAIHVR
jgi:two-component system chemotaxis response regulator CheB